MTIITLIPAVLHFSIAGGTESLGGSTNEINPTNICYLNGKLGSVKLIFFGNASDYSEF